MPTWRRQARARCGGRPRRAREARSRNRRHLPALPAVTARSAWVPRAWRTRRPWMLQCREGGGNFCTSIRMGCELLRDPVAARASQLRRRSLGAEVALEDLLLLQLAGISRECNPSPVEDVHVI